MSLFKRTKEIQIDLGNLTMKDIMNFPKWKAKNSNEFYLRNEISENHIQIGIVKGFSTFGNNAGIHDFIYDKETHTILIKSH